ncbi:hypothetical protein Cob_v012914 [Colletotrichum orbiculare MAFF 240422]|uniref:Uncharacterized protein n=1 Tax=Colletotrichum orbiculare (strain 104-T / ATCC 96160 / CBS 514.97 / LARS 414 / MAFF 240422) TaxID=1213857 RepID=A0A484F9U5_COLOR|nr:hypothetical protein Cob_v012914 [Colletotrichum orbiculare MAFF 240422]
MKEGEEMHLPQLSPQKTPRDVSPTSRAADYRDREADGSKRAYVDKGPFLFPTHSRVPSPFTHHFTHQSCHGAVSRYK